MSTYKINFNLFYAQIAVAEAALQEYALALSAFEQQSSTIESHPTDIWSLEILFDRKRNEADTIIHQINQLQSKGLITLLSEISLEEIIEQDWVGLYHAKRLPVIIKNYQIFFATEEHNIHLDKRDLTKHPIYLPKTQAFGSGEHHTTREVIKALRFLGSNQFNKILDVGTGSGILSFVSEHIWPKAKVWGCDIEEIAIECARENGIANQSKAGFFTSKAPLGLPSPYKISYDLIIANILPQPLQEMAPYIKEILAPQGYVILSGFLDEHFLAVISCYEELNFTLLKRQTSQEWQCVILKAQE